MSWAYDMRFASLLQCSYAAKVRRLPFNLKGFKYIEYDPDPGARESLAVARTKIAQYVANGLNEQVADSLVYEVLRERHISALPAERLNPDKAQLFTVRRAPKKRIGILTGDLRHITGIDIWVNSENTNVRIVTIANSHILV